MSTRRTKELARKLNKDENKHLRKVVLAWLDASEPWAKEMCLKIGKTGKDAINGERLRYVLNHYCPSLHHFCPDPARINTYGDIDTFNRLMSAHMLENTQAGVSSKDGSVIQEGVCYDAENLVAFAEEAIPFTTIGKPIETAKTNGWIVDVTDEAKILFSDAESEVTIIAHPSHVVDDIRAFEAEHADTAARKARELVSCFE